MTVFLSTGEASGEMSAAALVEAMRASEPGVRCVGIGSERLRAAGVEIVEETRGWASMGPLEAAGKIPRLWTAMVRSASRLRARPVDLVVFVDFGAFNVRFAKTLRWLGYRGPVLYFFPPGAWLDNAKQARAVARLTVPLTPFAHQRDFYTSLGLVVGYVGHPLVSLIEPRPRLPTPASDGGTIAILPGSRRGEIERHLPPLIAAGVLLRGARPGCRFVFSAADRAAEAMIAGALDDSPLAGERIVRGAQTAFDSADGAYVASGTAVLEAALREVPTVALYILSDAQSRIARRVYRGRFITLPNIVLDRALIPEFFQAAATPEQLAVAMAQLLDAPHEQLAAFGELRRRLGPSDALERCAAFALALARGQRVAHTS